MTQWINVIVQGVLVGGLYAMFAAGLSLIFGIMRLVNIAHGDLIVLAAYLALVATQTLGHQSAHLAGHRRAADGGARLRAAARAAQPHARRRPVAAAAGDLRPFGDHPERRCSKCSPPTACACRPAPSRSRASRSSPGISIGVLPLLQFVVAVVVIGALQVLFYRTALGRAFRATSDDPAVAQLMGLDNRHIFALGMALSLAVVAIAGVLLAIRTNFDPAIGPARLIFGFEAVIIGGLGSLWGTLAGGIVLGVAQGDRRPARSRLAGARRPSRLPRRARGAAGRPVSEGARMSGAARLFHGPLEPHRRRGVRRRSIVALVLAPYWAERQDLRLLAEIYAYVALASVWNLLAGYAGLVSIGQQAYVGLGAYLLFALTMLAGVPPLLVDPARGHHRRRRCRSRSRRWCSACAATISRSAPGWWRRCFACSASQVSALGGGSGTSLPANIVISIAREPAGARVPDLLDRARPRGAGAGADRRAAALALRPRAHRDPRQRGRRALERHRRHPGQARGLCDDGVRHGDGRRADLPAEAAHLARRRIQHQRLDGVRHLHRRDRRRRPHRGADHRHRDLLPAAPAVRRPRQPLSAACSARWRSPSCCSRRAECGGSSPTASACKSSPCNAASLWPTIPKSPGGPNERPNEQR